MAASVRLRLLHDAVRMGLSIRGVHQHEVDLPSGAIVPSMSYLDARARYHAAPDEEERPLTVLLHGLGSSVVTWSHVLPIASRMSPCVAPDLPGYGRTQLPEHEAYATLDEKVEAVCAFIDAMSPGRPVQLLGQSMGGWLAATVAAKAPERIERLVLTNPAGVFTPHVFLQRRLFSPADKAETKRLWEAMWHRLPRTFPLFAHAYFGLTKDPAVRGFLGDLKAEDFLNDKLHRIRARTLVIWGLSDTLMDYETVEIMRECIIDVRTRLIPDCGHVPQREAPEAFLDYLLPFLDGREPPEASLPGADVAAAAARAEEAAAAGA